jgi:hypothetical protein
MQTQPSQFENCNFQIEEETTRTHPPLLHAHLLGFPSKAPYWFFFPDPKLEKQTENSDTAFDAKRTEREKTATMMEDAINSASKQNKRRHRKAERRRCERTTQRREGEDDRAA